MATRWFVGLAWVASVGACADDGVDLLETSPKIRIEVAELPLGGCREGALAMLERGEARAPSELVLLREAHQGFVDLTVNWKRGRRSPSTQPIADACFTARVVDADGELVWEAEDLCASGLDGRDASELSLAWIGTCDAGSGEAFNTLTMTAERACDAAGSEVRDVALPCADGCRRRFRCVEHEDTFVEFDFR